MKKVKFFELDAENKDAALIKLLSLSQTYNFPGNTWKDEDSLREDLKQDYNPDDHFSFYVDENEELIVKIG